jgi:actin related protein 2/3 complex subunit 2
MADVISHIQTFRDYFHYHIKASKVRSALETAALNFADILLRHISTPA